MSKTVFLLTAEPPERGGGLEHFVRELLRGLELRGYRTQVFHRGNSEPPWLARQAGHLSKKVAATLQGYWIGRNAQRHIRDDVTTIISNGDVGFPPLRGRTAIRAIHIYHGTYRGQADALRPFITYSGYLYMKWWSSMVLERLSGRGKMVLCNSDQTSEEVRQFFGYNPITVWLPIDMQRFSPGDAVASRASLKLPQGRPIGLFVGSQHPMKGLTVVQSLMDRLPEIHWVCALRGGAPKALTRKPNIMVLSDVSHEGLPLLYRAADFSICSSLYEPFGYVVAEALACGTPVVTSPHGVGQRLYAGTELESLMTSSADHVVGFETAIRKVLSDPPKWRALIQTSVRPRLREMMAPEHWWRRFSAIAGI